MSDNAFEMTAVPIRGHGKRRFVEDQEAQVDRAKAEAAMAKWRVRTFILCFHAGGPVSRGRGDVGDKGSAGCSFERTTEIGRLKRKVPRKPPL